MDRALEARVIRRMRYMFGSDLSPACCLRGARILMRVIVNMDISVESLRQPHVQDLLDYYSNTEGNTEHLLNSFSTRAITVPACPPRAPRRSGLRPRPCPRPRHR
ncbi:hypothetical protein PCASD_10768 [Puccinia coronata f. sp. avenae]|nr:hypothetical protein PCASD_13746 [Puccinia coronata f. sp. avenae]PLW40894.1 hypothetical protein PCASD_10768 [Puccinia coronata f. sp. avenae]